MNCSKLPGLSVGRFTKTKIGLRVANVCCRINLLCSRSASAPASAATRCASETVVVCGGGGHLSFRCPCLPTSGFGLPIHGAQRPIQDEGGERVDCRRQKHSQGS